MKLDIYRLLQKHVLFSNDNTYYEMFLIDMICIYPVTILRHPERTLETVTELPLSLTEVENLCQARLIKAERVENANCN